MRFLVHPAATPRSRAPVRIFLAFAALALAALAAQRVLGGGLSPAGVEAFYLGSDEGEALSAVALWEEVHAGAFAYGLVLFVVGSVVATGRASARVRAVLLGAAAVATLADLFAPFAIAALGAGGALRVVTALAAWASLAALLAVAAVTSAGGGGDARA